MAFIIGITGGSGSGKTTLLGQIQALGGVVIDCDALYHKLLAEDENLIKKLLERYGNIATDGIIDRKKLGKIVFGDPVALGDLNRITHQFVHNAVLEILEAAPNLVAIDAIGLMESGLGDLCNTTICVVAPKKDRIKRLMLRENIAEDYAESRISAQKTDAEFMQMCQHTLENSGTQDQFLHRCRQLLQNILPKP